MGMFGNLCHILIFGTLRSFQGNQSAFLFTVEAISNIGIFLSIFPPYYYRYITGHDLTVISLFWCKFLFTISQTFGLCSLFTICFIAFDQFLSTNPRPNWRQISTLKLAHRFTLINICFVILLAIPFVVVTEISQENRCGISNPIVNVYYTFFYYPVLSSTLPIIITVTFSLFAYRNVRQIVRRQISLVHRRLDRQLTAMILARVVHLIILGLPYIIYSLYRLNLRTTEDNQLAVAIANLAGSIAYSILYMNFASNFYLFLIVSSRFRRQVKHFLAKKCCNLLIGLCHKETYNRNINTNQIAPETIHGVISDVESV